MSERKIIATHASTILIGQLATMGYSITDVAVVGHYSVQAQAALSVAASLFVMVFISMLASVQGILPVWAELLGARMPERLGAAVRQSLYLVAALTVFGMGVLLIAPSIMLPLVKVPAEMHASVKAYLLILAFTLPMAMGYRVFATLSQSIGMPHFVTWLQVAGLFVKVPLTILLVNGYAGFPELGIVGSAWATLAVQLSLLLLAVYLLRSQLAYKPFKLWSAIEPIQWAQQRDFVRLAIPAGLMASIEVSSFAIVALLISRQGAAITAAHQVASNFAAICYMFPLSLAIAASARVSFWRGAGNELMAIRLARASLLFGFGMALVLASVLYLFRVPFTGLYTNNLLVQSSSAALLGWIALYHIADATQIISIFLLRSWRITIAPMVIYPLMLWGVGVAGGYLLAYHGLLRWPAQLGAWPFWAASVVALTLTAICLLWLLLSKLNTAARQSRMANLQAQGA